MLSIPQHISHQQLFTERAGKTGINHFAPDKNNLIKLFASTLFDINIIFFSAFLILNEFNFMEHCLIVDYHSTFSFLLHTILILHYPMPLLLLILATCVGYIALENTNKWEKMVWHRKPNLKKKRFTQQAGERA